MERCENKRQLEVRQQQAGTCRLTLLWTSANAFNTSDPVSPKWCEKITQQITQEQDWRPERWLALSTVWRSGSGGARLTEWWWWCSVQAHGRRGTLMFCIWNPNQMYLEGTTAKYKVGFARRLEQFTGESGQSKGPCGICLQPQPWPWEDVRTRVVSIVIPTNSISEAAWAASREAPRSAVHEDNPILNILRALTGSCHYCPVLGGRCPRHWGAGLSFYHGCFLLCLLQPLFCALKGPGRVRRVGESSFFPLT